MMRMRREQSLEQRSSAGPPIAVDCQRGPLFGSRNDTALEQIIARMSLEPFVTAAHLQAEQTAAEA
jgi:hypothetical protein